MVFQYIFYSWLMLKYSSKLRAMRRINKQRPESRKHRKEKMEFWSERNEVKEPDPDHENNDSEISSTAIEYQKELARRLQEVRLEYICTHHKEPDFTEYEFGLIAKYC